MRSFYRQFPQDKVPDAYYDYLRQADVPENERQNKLFSQYPEQAEQVEREARLAELGKDDHGKIYKWIQDALDGYGEWVLIGGPPCQAYSVVGRSRNRGNDDYDAEKDHRQYLYLEYLQIIAEHQPAIFVMENVKGLLSATLKNQYIFGRMYEDLQEPKKALKREDRPVRSPVPSKPCRYKLYSLIKPGEISNLNLSDFAVHMEYFGIPQARLKVMKSDLERKLVQKDEELKQELHRLTTELEYSKEPSLWQWLFEDKNRMKDILQQLDLKPQTRDLIINRIRIPNRDFGSVQPSGENLQNFWNRFIEHEKRLSSKIQDLIEASRPLDMLQNKWPEIKDYFIDLQYSLEARLALVKLLHEILQQTQMEEKHIPPATKG